MPFSNAVTASTDGAFTTGAMIGFGATASGGAFVGGATNPVEAATGSIRGDYGLEVQSNLVHGSDGPESAAREIALFFPSL